MRCAVRTMAFTLAELMVVVAIVALLSGLLIQGLVSVLRAAGRYHCSSNLRQIAAALTAYTADHGGWYPAEGNKGITNPLSSPAWFYRLPAYADGIDARSRNSIFQCGEFTAKEPEIFDNASPKSLKMNGYLDRKGKGVRRWCYHSGRWRQESSIVLFIDAVAGETGMGQWGHCPTSAVCGDRHGGMVNVLFLDGHSQSVIDEPEEQRKGKPDWREQLNWKEKQALGGSFD